MEWIKKLFSGDTAKQLRKIKNDPTAVKGLVDPNFRTLTAAINVNFRCIAFIEPLTPALVEVAVGQNPSALKYLPKQPDDVCVAAISADPRCIKYIKDPSDELIELAVSKMGNLIGLFPDASDDLQVVAVKSDAEAITRIKNPCEAAQLLAIGSYAKLFLEINNPTVNSAIAFLEGCEKASKDPMFKWNFKMHNCHSFTTDQWWEIVFKFPTRHQVMILNSEQRNYAILCA